MMISIVLCCYNGEKFIFEQIESILNQTYKDFELIIIDDQSTDSTRTILEDLREKDKRIALHINNENLGPRFSFYKGIKIANGDYIALSDQDDIWIPEKLEKLINTINKEQKNTLLYYSNSQIIDENGKKNNIFLSDKINPYMGNDNRVVLFFNFAWGHTMIFNKILVKKLDPIPEAFNHDKWLLYLALTHGSVFYIDEVLQYYRHHNNNLTVKNKNNGKLCDNPKIKEANNLEWIKYIADTGSLNQDFFKKIVQYKNEGGLSIIRLFLFLFKNMEIVLYPSKKNYLKKLNFLRKFLSV